MHRFAVPDGGTCEFEGGERRERVVRPGRSEEPEVPEFIDIRIDVRNDLGNLVHSSDVVRVTIQGHGNTVAFSSDAGSITEGNETFTLHIDRPLPAGTEVIESCFGLLFLNFMPPFKFLNTICFPHSVSFCIGFACFFRNK